MFTVNTDMNFLVVCILIEGKVVMHFQWLTIIVTK